ncbi:64_t:CDS:2, partial [Paraglomus brasilianum]
MTHKYIIEHMETDLHEWCILEYSHIATSVFPPNIIITRLKDAEITVLKKLQALDGAQLRRETVDEMGINKSKICLLHPNAEQQLKPEDGQAFDYFLFGGILGDDPPRDRTSELCPFVHATRHLGQLQMTTDTAFNVTKKIIEDKVQLCDIPFIDFPELVFDKNESVIMPFRYIAIPHKTKSTLQTTNNEMKQNM